MSQIRCFSAHSPYRADKLLFAFCRLPSNAISTDRIRPNVMAVYLSFDDDRLADIEIDQLDLLLEEYCRRNPELRQRKRWGCPVVPP